MSEEIIKVLDYICAQLGIAVDWSAENVMPQVMDVLGRYRVYTIANTVVNIIWLLLILFVWYLLAKKCIKDIKNKTVGIWWELSYYGGSPSYPTIIFMVASFFVVPFMITGIYTNVSDILQWAIVPEIKYLEILKGLMA